MMIGQSEVSMSILTSHLTHYLNFNAIIALLQYFGD